MTTFEVTFESAEGRALKLLVAADNWVEAWQDGLFALGIDTAPEDATYEVTDDGVRGELPTQGRRFRVRVVRDPVSRPSSGPSRHPSAATRPIAPTPAVAFEPPEPPTQREPTRDFEPPEPPTQRKPTRDFEPPEPPTQRKSTRDFEPPEPPTAPSQSARALTPPRRKRPATETTAPEAPSSLANSRPSAGPTSRPSVGPASRPVVTRPAPRRPETPDPIARVLSDLERQRLLARPMRISPQTGLPTPVPAGRNARRTPTPQQVPRPGASDEQRPRRATTAFSVETDAALPQQFRPVLSAQAPRDQAAALQWAADTAWEHVPCGLALLIGVDLTLVATLDERDALDADVVVQGEILAARGELARELKGCLVPVSAGPATLTARRPSRIRFSADARLLVESLDERTWQIPVTSVLRVPLERADAERLGFGVLGLVLLNAARNTGFTDGEASAVTYLARTLANLASP